MLNKLITYSIGILFILSSCDSKNNHEYREYKSSLYKKVEKDLDYNLGRERASFKSTIRSRGGKPSEVTLLKQWNVLDELLNANDNVDINQIDSILLEDVGDYYKNFGNKIKLELLDTIFDSLDNEVIKKLIRFKVFKSFYVIQVGASSFCFDMIEELVMPNILNPCKSDTLIIKKYPAISSGHCSGFPYGEIEFDGKVLVKNDLGCEILIKPENHKLGWNHWTANLHIYDRYSDTIIPISGSYYVK